MPKIAYTRHQFAHLNAKSVFRAPCPICAAPTYKHTTSRLCVTCRTCRVMCENKPALLTIIATEIEHRTPATWKRPRRCILCADINRSRRAYSHYCCRCHYVMRLAEKNYGPQAPKHLRAIADYIVI